MFFAHKIYREPMAGIEPATYSFISTPIYTMLI